METPTTISGNRDRRKELGLLAILAFAWVGLLCLPWALSQALWTDDLYSLRTASFPFWEIIRLTWEYHPGNFDHPPLYFLILRPISLISSEHLFVRLPSLLFLILTSIVLALDLRARGASLAGAVAIGFLIVLHPLTRHAGICVRMYTLFLLLIVSLLWTIWRAADARGGWFATETWIAGLLMALMCYTSYFGFVMGLGIATLALAWTAFPRLASSGANYRPGARLLLAGIIALLLLIPWLPALGHLASSERESQQSIYEMTRISQLRILAWEFGGGWIGLTWIITGWIALLVIGVQRARWLSMLFGIVIIPSAFMAIVTPESRLVLARYLIFVVAVLLSGAVMGWDAVTRKWSNRPRLQIGLLCGLILIPAPFMDHVSRTGKLKFLPDWWEAAAIIETQIQPGEIILTGGFLSGELIEYHMENPAQHRFMHRVLKLDPFYVACRSPEVAWYVTGSTTPPGYEDILNRYFPYRAELEGNQGLSPIRVMSKKPFRLTSGDQAQYQAPIPLDYEQAGYRQSDQN